MTRKQRDYEYALFLKDKDTLTDSEIDWIINYPDPYSVFPSASYF